MDWIQLVHLPLDGHGSRCSNISIFYYSFIPSLERKQKKEIKLKREVWLPLFMLNSMLPPPLSLFSALSPSFSFFFALSISPPPYSSCFYDILTRRDCTCTPRQNTTKGISNQGKSWTKYLSQMSEDWSFDVIRSCPRNKLVNKEAGLKLNRPSKMTIRPRNHQRVDWR